MYYSEVWRPTFRCVKISWMIYVIKGIPQSHFDKIINPLDSSPEMDLPPLPNAMRKLSLFLFSASWAVEGEGLNVTGGGWVKSKSQIKIVRQMLNANKPPVEWTTGNEFIFLGMFDWTTHFWWNQKIFWTVFGKNFKVFCSKKTLCLKRPSLWGANMIILKLILLFQNRFPLTQTAAPSYQRTWKNVFTRQSLLGMCHVSRIHAVFVHKECSSTSQTYFLDSVSN